MVTSLHYSVVPKPSACHKIRQTTDPIGWGVGNQVSTQVSRQEPASRSRYPRLFLAPTTSPSAAFGGSNACLLQPHHRTEHTCSLDPNHRHNDLTPINFLLRLLLYLSTYCMHLTAKHTVWTRSIGEGLQLCWTCPGMTH